jgi:hypothetical protein
LGKNGQHAARQLAKVLFADVLEDEEAWEKILSRTDDGGSILLKYGEVNGESGVQKSSPLIQTLDVPSPLLQRLNLEILVTPLGDDIAVSGNAANLEETILVPPVTISNSSAGRVGFVRHPVHRALIVAEGISGAIAYGKLPPGCVNGETVNAALSIPLRPAPAPVATSGEAEAPDNSIDIDLASHSISIFRADKANGAQFSKEWQASRVPIVTTWLKRAVDNSTTEDGLKPAVRGLIEVLLSSAERAVKVAESRATKTSAASNVPDTIRNTLRQATATWSEEAHGDLSVNLDTALDSTAWRKTAWWRLFWRIDEVSLSASEILVRSWLIEAEQTLAFLSGRMLQAGVASAADMRGVQGAISSSSTDPSVPTKKLSSLLNETHQAIIGEYNSTKETSKPQGTVAEVLNFAPMLARVQKESGLNPLFNPPWPQSIGVARQQMLHELVPALHRKAQGLLVNVLSLMGGSGVLAGTVFAASSGTALYEAGAVAALGFVWSLRRLQVRWGRERKGFSETVRENGRRVLLDVEEQLRGLIENGGRLKVDGTSEREWREARKALKAAREALEKLSKKDGGQAAS